MNRSPSFGTHRWLPPGSARRFGLVACLLGASLPAVGCTRNQIKSLLKLADKSEGASQESVDTAPPPVVRAPSGAVPSQVRPDNPVSAIDVDPGSGREVTLAAGLRIIPPETFNVISEQEGSDFRSDYVHYRWERLSGGAWFIVTILSGLDYEGDRAPKIEDGQVVLQRVQVAFARVDEKHQMRSIGSQPEMLAGQRAIRTNVAGKVEGEDAVGHLYLLADGKHLIEIVALATESNRSVLKVCRESVATLSRGPAGDR